MKKFRKGHWKETFRIHVLNLERFLFSRGTPAISGEQSVYLAGMIARKLDRAYQSMIRDMLWEDPQAADYLIRKHDAYIGQNAPIVTLSRINAEYLTLQIARKGDPSLRELTMSLPARYYGIASYYSNQAGNRTLAEIFRFLGNHLPLVLDILEGYFNYVEAFGDRSETHLASEFWERFGNQINERNAKKEGWEKRGIDPSRKTHISRAEFNRMIDFTSKN